MMLPDGKGGPHVFVHALETPELSNTDRRHLARSLDGTLSRVRTHRKAGMHSRRVRLATVEAVTTYRDVPSGAVRADCGAASISAERTTVLIGAEGGWSRVERQVVSEVAVAGHVLRAETASIAAATLITVHRSQAHS